MRGSLQSLLATDIVASTRLWAEHESAMAADLRTHDELVTGAITATGGRVFKHTGDGVMATFDGAIASAVAASAIQRAIAGQAWLVPDGLRVRMALHSGGVHEREGDLFGPTINRLARLLSRSSSGGVLVSETSASLLTNDMPDGLELRELGRIELRDVGHSETVHCLVGEHLVEVDAYDVIGARAARVGSVPRIDDDLVGRAREIAAVLDAIAAHPVVSIVGVGGMGKTRLALESAAAADLPDGAWWCDLAAATSASAVPATALAAIGARQSAGRSAVESVVDYLATQRALIVFDNCEHVVDAARSLVSAIRAGCDKVRVLATSREALGLRGEHVISLSSLPADDAIGLFCTRANEARADLQFDDATLASIDEICTRLDGIPLAIELAAARCRSMAPAEIATRLDDRFRFLRGGRGSVERHRTLQAAVEWSHSLLDDDERALFDRMAVFAGGALIDAVAAVGGLDEYEALDIIDRLVARSMVVATDTALGTRYRQLETLRQYADDRLVERGTAQETRQRHLDWACSLARWLRSAGWTSEEVPALRRYIAEIDNFRAAVHYAVAIDQLQEACVVIHGLAYQAFCRSTFEITDWIEPTQIPADEWTNAVVSTAGLGAVLAYFAGDPLRVAQLLASIPAGHEDNAWTLTAATYESLWTTGDFDLAERRLAGVTPADDLDRFSLRLNQAQVFQTRVYYADPAPTADSQRDAVRHFEDLVADAREAGAQLSLAGALVVHGYFLFGLGDVGASLAAQTEALEVSDPAGAWLTVDGARIGQVLAIARIAGTDPGRIGESAATLRVTVAAALAHRNNVFVADYLSTVVEQVLCAAGDHRTAALLGRFGRLKLPMNALLPPAADPELLGVDTVAEIETEAAQLDFDTAGALALAALDRVIAARS